MKCPECEIEVGEVEQCPKCQLDLTLFDEDGLKRLERANSIIERRKKKEREAAEAAARAEAAKKKQQKKDSFWKGLTGGK